MSAITLPEYAKSFDAASKQRAIIELFPEAVDFMGAIPFMNAPGGAYRYQEEGALATNVAFRALNEEPSSGYGLLSDRVEQTIPSPGTSTLTAR